MDWPDLMMAATRTPSLQNLLAATAAGDEDAFARLYAATSRQVFAVILRIVPRRDWAEDVLQEVYLTVWDHAADYRPERGAPMAWLVTIGRNRALDRQRKKLMELPIDAVNGRESWADHRPSPLDWAMVSADARRLKRCLDGMEQPQRDCIVLAMVEGYTHGELSERLDYPLGTVKSWIRRGLFQLRNCLEQ